MRRAAAASRKALAQDTISRDCDEPRPPGWAVIERNNAGDNALKIEMWPESHLERLGATRTNREFGLS